MKQFLTLLLPVTGLLFINRFNYTFLSTEKAPLYAVTDTAYKEMVSKTKGYEAKTTGITFTRIETYLDSSYYPRSLYYNIRFAEVTGVAMAAVNSGKLKVELLKDNKETMALVKEPRLYAAKAFKEGEQINILFSIPLSPTDINNKNIPTAYCLKLYRVKK